MSEAEEAELFVPKLKFGWKAAAAHRNYGRAMERGAMICRLAVPSDMTPPLEVIRPPSNAATTFLRPTAGKPNCGLLGLKGADIEKLAAIGLTGRP